MRLTFLGAALALLSCFTLAASDEPEEKPRNPCTIRSPTTGSYFDLTPLNVTAPTPEERQDMDEADLPKSWHARGYDYGANFTLNVCGAVVEKLDEVEGITNTLDRLNVSAFYVKAGRTYSIGSLNEELVIRGRKLVLNYTNGSPCPSIGRHKRETKPEANTGFSVDKVTDGDDDKDTNTETIRRKSTIMSLLCERDPLAAKATVSFVGHVDECAYFFEIRSSAACPSVEVAEQQLGPGAVFGVIALIAVLVYVAGGCMYQRTVQNQRGWRQLPNYSLWAGIGAFFRDIFIIFTSSCLRCLPGRRGYGPIASGRRRGRLGNSDDENRLIDQLDEEWED